MVIRNAKRRMMGLKVGAWDSELVPKKGDYGGVWGLSDLPS
jgi:hypothetical protein